MRVPCLARIWIRAGRRCTCVCVCVRVRVCACVRARVHVCAYVRMCAGVVGIRGHTWARVRASWAYVGTCGCARVGVRGCAWAYVRMQGHERVRTCAGVCGRAGARVGVRACAGVRVCVCACRGAGARARALSLRARMDGCGYGVRSRTWRFEISRRARNPLRRNGSAVRCCASRASAGALRVTRCARSRCAAMLCAPQHASLLSWRHALARKLHARLRSRVNYTRACASVRGAPHALKFFKAGFYFLTCALYTGMPPRARTHPPCARTPTPGRLDTLPSLYIFTNSRCLINFQTHDPGIVNSPHRKSTTTPSHRIYIPHPIANMVPKLPQYIVKIHILFTFDSCCQ